MKPSDTSDPAWFHRVVDCQWACPAHTDVPEYIRLIAQGRHTDAYLLNRQSNVFPGILGRVCDRPCEPACRRGRIDDKPVAICRIKRVAADNREPIEQFLPRAPTQRNGQRIALIGAGPASLTVANDLAPLGYECVIFERQSVAGGLMRYNIPAFRLPGAVLDEEIGYIIDMGVELRLNSPVASMQALLEQGFDAVFVGSGAPKGKNLELDGRDADPDRVHIGINWLESVAFGHVDRIGERVLIIGAGNTAMDCCRTSLRLGGRDVKVMARKPRAHFKASDWELEDAEEERVEILECHSPEGFAIEHGRLVGMRFARLRYEEDASGRLRAHTIDEVVIPCDDVILAIGQDNSFPWIERDIGIEFDEWDMPAVDRKTFQSSRAGVFFGGDAAWGPENIIWAVEHGHQAAISIHKHCQGEPLEDRLAFGMNLSSRKMGVHEWSYSNDYDTAHRGVVPQAAQPERFRKLTIEVELGFTGEQAAIEAQRCLNCDIQTVFTEKLCIECDACVDVCPVDCLMITPNAGEGELRERLKWPARNLAQPLYVSGALKQTDRVMVKDENVCVHCGLCAERCPTAAWDMQKSTLLVPYARDEKENKDSWQRTRKAG
jgi:NADPH-dependent glutamate synthase beta subunit-like oxidoreductase/ferredoxin